MEQEKIVVLDFGSQYAHLIAKRLRLLGFYSEIAAPSVETELVKDARGIIFSGGPSSVYETLIPSFNSNILNLDIPILGLCYGHQLMAQKYSGEVKKASVGEFGITHLQKSHSDGKVFPKSPLFSEIAFPTQVWMSHQDSVVTLPKGFEVIAATKDCPFAALQNLEKKRFSLQCHIEVKDTPEGDSILYNFAHDICGMEKNWSQDKVLETILRDIVETADGKNTDGKKRKVLLFLSGGVDSTVAFALLNKALGQDRVLGLHIDNGFMRKNESFIIDKRYREAGFTNFIVEDASKTFLEAVFEETDPQRKRKAIGETFITIRDQVVARLNLNEAEWLLGQGTLYPDIIESGGTLNSHVIKTHHNRVAGIQALIEKNLIIEPLKDLYKDEVRIIGKKIGLSDELVFRHPFPGPGLSINVLGSTGVFTDKEELNATVTRLQDISLLPIASYSNFSKVYALPVRSVGVQGDVRTYRFPAVLRFTQILEDFPSWSDLEETSSLITNTSTDVNRTVLELWKADSSPLLLKEAYCDRPRLDQTREADAIVLEELKNERWYGRIFQHLTINLPLSTKKGHCTIVLRPVVSEDVMTARFAHLDLPLLKRIVERIAALGFVDAIFYDITNKPPATFGWE